MTLYNAEPHKIAVDSVRLRERRVLADRAAVRAPRSRACRPTFAVLLSVGRLVPRKGVDNVIRALGVLVRRLGVPAELLVVGGNSDIADPTCHTRDRPAASRRRRSGRG